MAWIVYSCTIVNEMQEDTASSSAAEQSSSPSAIEDVDNNEVSLKRKQEPQTSAQISNSRISQHLETLEHLDKQHQHLLGVEQCLQKYLGELQKEEQSLREALVQSSTTLKEQRQSEKERKEAEALARLEDALMNDDDSDSSTSC